MEWNIRKNTPISIKNYVQEKLLFVSYSHRKWLVKNHPDKWKEDALFVIKELENLFLLEEVC